jgi:Second Messenger Oligonucleotide or Dinucleotide Synthetase domain
MNMTDNEYLKKVLDKQKLEEGSDEIKNLRERRDEIESFLREKFSGYEIKFYYAGSYKKKTLIKELYDLDLTCYFPSDTDKTLEEIYNEVAKALREKYFVKEKASALRIKSKDGNDDFHIDVVPGRFIDETNTDVFLYRNVEDEHRLKTNLKVHLEHIRDSELRKQIRLAKLWRIRNGLQIRTFPLELLVIKVLKDSEKKDQLDDRMKEFWVEIRDNIDNISIVDPANSNNDLSEIFDSTVKNKLSKAAKSTLKVIEESGWKSVFGEIEEEAKEATVARVNAAVASSSYTIAKPYCDR